MTIDSVLIDDEINNIENLKNLLKINCPQIEVLGSATNVDDGIRVITKCKPQLIFLDINMPGQNGFDLLRRLPNRSFEVIFITAHDNFAIQAVKFAAMDYLLKPVDVSELIAAVNRVIDKKIKTTYNPELENFLNIIMGRSSKLTHKIALNTVGQTRFVLPSEIIRCESSNNYTTFFLADGDKIVVSRPIYEFELALADYGFIRCHQSHLVNCRFVKSWLKKDGDVLLLENGNQVPISRAKKEEVNQALERSGYR